MPGWMVLIAFLLAPLACWALLARTKVLGWAFAIVFAAYAATEGGLMAGAWPFRDEPSWLLLGLPVMSVVALAAGAVLEAREFATSDPEWGIRGITGLLVSSCYGLAVIGGAALVHSMLGPAPPAAAAVPPLALVKPLGPGLAVTQEDTSCGTGQDPGCSTVFMVTSTSGPPGSAVLLERVRSQLTQAHGWRLYAREGEFFGCRESGGQAAFVQIGRGPHMVIMRLDSSLALAGLSCG